MIQITLQPAGEPNVKEDECKLPKPGDYNQDADPNLASTRSKSRVRSHEAVAAATKGDLPLGAGLAFRSRMAGAMENDQFPYSTDECGKPLK